MSFSECFDPSTISAQVNVSITTSKAEIEHCINKSTFSIHDLPILLSPQASTYLEHIASRANQVTRQRFGNTMQLFIPMYLSNECYNKCTYCGFSVEHKYPRVTLTDDEILKEGLILKEKGFSHVLLLTGEAPGKVGTDYIANAIRILRPHFASIGIEVQPLSYNDYKTVIDAGADSLTLYQETYHPEAYKEYHLAGKKKHFSKRLDALEYGAKAGFYRINIGALLGLYDWRFEAFSIASHLSYLSKHYWQSKYAVSFPRINEMFGEFNPKVTVSDTELVQLICAFRLVFPDIGITLSTREPASLRNHIFKLGVTQMSAESHTEPGGYSGKEAEKQFEISDTRTVNEIKQLLIENGYDPVHKDWYNDTIALTTTSKGKV